MFYSVFECLNVCFEMLSRFLLFCFFLAFFFALLWPLAEYLTLRLTLIKSSARFPGPTSSICLKIQPAYPPGLLLNPLNPLFLVCFLLYDICCLLCAIGCVVADSARLFCCLLYTV
jgi:hypothetical protein